MSQEPTAQPPGPVATRVGIILDGCTVSSVLRGSPASFAEVDLVGQTIALIDSHRVDSATIQGLLKGSDVPGSKLSLTLGTGQTVSIVRDSSTAIQARAAVYDSLKEHDAEGLLSMLEPFLKCDPWQSSQEVSVEAKKSEGAPPSRSLQELHSQLAKANEKLSQNEMLQQRMSALETQLKDARTTLAQRSQTAKTGAEVEHLRRSNKALQSTLDSLLTVGESVTVSSPVIAQAQDVPLSPHKVQFGLTLPSEGGIRGVPPAGGGRCDFCEMNGHVVGKWKVLRRAFVQQQLDHAAEIEEATRALLRLRECLVKMQPRPGADTQAASAPSKAGQVEVQVAREGSSMPQPAAPPSHGAPAGAQV